MTKPTFQILMGFSIGAVLAVCVIYGLPRIVRASNPVSSFNCTPQPGESCPSEKFAQQYKDYLNLKGEIDRALQDKAVKEIERKNYQLNGMADALNAQVPQGYQLDDKKMRFVPKPQSVPAAAAPAPMPATPAPAVAPKPKSKK